MAAVTDPYSRLSELIRQAPADKLARFAARLDGTTAAEAFRRAVKQSEREVDEDDWAAWLPWLFPSYFPVPFAPHHGELWDWVWSIELGVKPANAFIAVWARGGAKSTSAEAAVTSLGARRRRNYVVYVCETQPQADDHVGNIGSMLESRQVSDAYPLLGDRAVGKFGSSKGWRRNRLRTASGFIVDALGLDVAARGLKIDEERPDMLVFDDIDDTTDGPGQVAKKISAITTKLLPAGSSDVAVLGIQNLVHANGVFGHLAGTAEVDEQDDFLTNRIVSGPVPALLDATFEPDEIEGGYRIITGTPTWEGQSLATCQSQVNEWGYTAFLAEAQHDVDAKGGGMFDHVVFRHVAREDCPPFQRVEVWCDPAVTNTDKSDSMAVQCDAMGVDKAIYRLRSWEHRSTPEQAIKLAVAWAMCEGALTVGIETDQGGDTWRSVFKLALQGVKEDLKAVRAGDGIQSKIPEYVLALAELSGREAKLLVTPRFAQAKAGSTQQPKEHRIQQMLTGGYEQRGAIFHVIGTHLILERALFRFPARKPYDLADAAYWSWVHLSAYGRPTKTNRKSTEPFPKLPVARPGTSAYPRVGFGRVIPGK